MRKWNNILARVILILFLLHALMGSLMLLGISNLSIRPFSWLLLTAVAAHGILGILSTIRAIKSGKQSGKWYLQKKCCLLDKAIFRFGNFDFAWFSYHSIYHYNWKPFLSKRIHIRTHDSTDSVDSLYFCTFGS